MTIKFYNSATRTKDVFAPIDPDHVRLYACGPTVYDRAHLGNARSAVVFDVLARLLRHVYPRVTYVRNITDVDDKINARAAQTGRPIADITEETTGWYHDDMDALGVARPDHEPRATEYIAQMVAMIEGLIEKGHAYAAEGHVLFRVRSYEAYGALSGRSVDDMIAGARVEVAPFKEDPMDFVLWKPAGDGPGWDGPLGPEQGPGRPGWHIECSAMAAELLGETFDIHGGGLDLQFPHHENEIAQSVCAHGAPMAKVWLHNEMLQVEGRKMSKSLGNFFTVRELLDQGWPGEVIRFVLLSTHYRKPMDWTEKGAFDALKELENWSIALQGFDEDGEAPEEIIEILGQDLNVPAALAKIRSYAKAKDLPALKGSLALLGLKTITRRVPYSTDTVKTSYNPYFDHWILRSLELSERLSTGSEVAYWGEVARELVRHWALFWGDKDFVNADERINEIRAIGFEASVRRSGTMLDVSLSLNRPVKIEQLEDLAKRRLSNEESELCRTLSEGASS